MKHLLSACLFLLGALSAQASMGAPDTYYFSYHFDAGGGIDVSGTFVGSRSGNLITNISGVTASFNGSPVTGPLFAVAHDSGGPRGWSTSAPAVVSFDGTANDFVFVNSDVAGGDSSGSQFFDSLTDGTNSFADVDGVQGGSSNGAQSLPFNSNSSWFVGRAQTIDFSQPADHVFGDAAFALSATATSGLDVSFSVVSGPATITSGMLTITGAGTVVVRAAQAGDANYGPAPTVDQSFAVTAAAASVTLQNLTPTYNGSAQPVSVVTSPASLAVSVTYDGNTTAPTSAGTYAVVATITDPNYSGSASGSLVIGKVSLTVTASDATRAFGAADPTFAATYSGFVGSDTAAVVGGAPDLTTTATNTSGVGPYAIDAAIGTLSAVNYSFDTFVPGTLTITQASASVSLGALAANYDGSAKPVSVMTTPSGIAYAITYNGSSTVPGNAGSYAVSASITDPNYSGSASGTLVIAPAALTVTAANASRAYGDANPTFSAAVSGFVGTDTSAVVSGAPSITSTATSTSNVGNYAITPTLGTLSASNYVFTSFVPGTLTISQASATISLGALSATYSGSANAVTATTTPTGLGVAVTYDGNSAAPTNAGSYAIAATVTDSNYSGSATGTLVIAPAGLTVTATGATKVYGASNPTFSATYSGFVGSDTAAVVSGSPMLTTTATSTSGVGSYPITPAAGSLAAANYTFSNFVAGSLSVTPAPLTVTAQDATRVYGAANPTFTAAFSGLVNGDLPSVVSGFPAITTTASATSGVGNYAITPTAGSLTAANYSFSNFVAGSLSVTPASLTVTADNAQRPKNKPNPAFTVHYTGFVNGDTATVLTTAPVAATTAVTNSPAGTYPISVTGGAAANYTLAYADGTLTVQNVVIGDFNGDGKMDLVWQNLVTGDRSLWFMDGSNISDFGYIAQIDAPWTIVGKADLNGDGKTDLIWENLSTGDRTAWLMDGINIDSQIYLAYVDPAWHIAALGDFNGDGQTDIVWENTTTGDRSVWFMHGAEVDSFGYIAGIDPAWRIVGAADVDGDGQTDLIWENRTTGDRTVWFMNGITLSSFGYFAMIPGDWHIASVTDLNNDGHPDLVWENTTTGDRAVWLMNGTTQVSAPYLALIDTNWSIAP
ncbi:MAG TPA: MBG domain-containing protein [Candidatus Didemnitutus sp.]|nr:MBG domain-containing protein [Candidatus Didemnitutus sp.]